MKRLILFLSFALVACGKPNADLPQAPNVPANAYEAICEIVSSSNQPIVCIDFPTNSNANSSSCMSTEQNNYTPEGAIAGEYEGVQGAGVWTSCALANTGLTLVGSCVHSDRVVRYYNVIWSAASAQSNCAFRGGQWAP